MLSENQKKIIFFCLTLKILKTFKSQKTSGALKIFAMIYRAPSRAIAVPDYLAVKLVNDVVPFAVLPR